MERKTKLIEALKIKIPVVQGPMLGVTTPAMVAAVSNSGGLGSLPVGGLAPDKVEELIQATKRLTDQPFAVNVFAHEIPTHTNPAILNAMQDFLAAFSLAHGLPYTVRDTSEFKFVGYQEQLDSILRNKVPVVSSTFGVLDQHSMSRLQEKKITVIGTATSVAEALVLEQSGVAIVTAQGIEAGGHRGSFLQQDRLPQIGSMSLIPLISDAVQIPVLAAGGIATNRAMRAAFLLGAAGVQVGSLFIPAAESAASEIYKEAVMGAKDTDTVVTKALTGRWARGIRNVLLESIENAGLEIPDYVIHNFLTSGIRSFAAGAQRKEFLSLWAGQSSSKAKRGTTAELFLELVQDGW
ncbi:NAD(P)H-dependent flavin oxidoreductase [Flavobacterium kingsejongi]|uniref:Propionate 3-nitronate monooxygenase n=1 Tax=Flavobacterium kingsejongi TaxID=1678728 RepID=A0A2S1LQB5_9FLAO|nr:nitronate monooxygenase [Flavobacterium kingsejongi]AWG25953.1 hypothetical protein FK004_12330 [Flavobacterium kingsejongi]